MKNIFASQTKIFRLLAGLSWRKFGFSLVLVSIAALIVNPYFSDDFSFVDIWMRLAVPGCFMFVTYIVTGNIQFTRWKLYDVRIVALVISAFLGTIFGGLLLGRSLQQLFTTGSMLAGIFVVTTGGILVGVIATMFLHLREREVRSQLDLAESETRRLQLEKNALSSHLQILKAQIEPHFLFNTLANVQYLVEYDAAAASTMLANLIRYLRAALPEMRAEQTTLAKEVDMSMAYLAILQVRMGKRLSYQIDIPKDLESMAFPPLMLMTLVENAIKHGVDPGCQEGWIWITAQHSDLGVAITVRDNGPGMTLSSGGGVGLKNIRERLQAMYGGSASLILSEPETGGFMATLQLPRLAETPGE
ncbi:sensor histidine kinase [Undibacterium parvum]|uniref:Histidine kinase/HSP90-like ATPase domain-containing protein n=1 Tax=Undibacterium parvum TaxID=401471 RepID=A0A3Q9BMU1_9BURK|nr:histidine kinase [Undibacterium parvum]AZP10617.1 hypothetical protein EJN92_00350 [Undibacterium parvum]